MNIKNIIVAASLLAAAGAAMAEAPVSPGNPVPVDPDPC